MDIFFDEERRNDEEFVKTLANKIGKSTVNDILSDFNLNYADMQVEAVLDDKKINEKRLNKEDIIQTIKESFKNKVTINDNNIIFEPAKPEIRELRLCILRRRLSPEAYLLL